MEKKIIVLNKLGLHARPAGMIAACANDFQSEISLISSSGSADCRSIIAIIILAATCGTEMTLSASGIDEADAINAISNLFESKFNEE